MEAEENGENAPPTTTLALAVVQALERIMALRQATSLERTRMSLEYSEHSADSLIEFSSSIISSIIETFRQVLSELLEGTKALAAGTNAPAAGTKALIQTTIEATIAAQEREAQRLAKSDAGAIDALKTMALRVCPTIGPLLEKVCHEVDSVSPVASFRGHFEYYLTIGAFKDNDHSIIIAELDNKINMRMVRETVQLGPFVIGRFVTGAVGILVAMTEPRFVKGWKYVPKKTPSPLKNAPNTETDDESLYTKEDTQLLLVDYAPWEQDSMFIFHAGHGKAVGIDAFRDVLMIVTETDVFLAKYMGGFTGKQFTKPRRIDMGGPVAYATLATHIGDIVVAAKLEDGTVCVKKITYNLFDSLDVSTVEDPGHLKKLVLDASEMPKGHLGFNDVGDAFLLNVDGSLYFLKNGEKTIVDSVVLDSIAVGSSFVLGSAPMTTFDKSELHSTDTVDFKDDLVEFLVSGDQGFEKKQTCAMGSVVSLGASSNYFHFLWKKVEQKKETTRDKKKETTESAHPTGATE